MPESRLRRPSVILRRFAPTAPVRTANAGDLAGLRFVDPQLRADPERAQSVRLAVDQGHCIVATEGDDIVGYVVITDRFLGQTLVELLVVGPAHRRQGVGSRLLDEAEKRCHRKKLFISCNRSNMPAQWLFEKCGYERSGQIYNLDQEDPELVYFKALTASKTPQFSSLPARAR